MKSLLIVLLLAISVPCFALTDAELGRVNGLGTIAPSEYCTYEMPKTYIVGINTPKAWSSIKKFNGLDNTVMAIAVRIIDKRVNKTYYYIILPTYEDFYKKYKRRHMYEELMMSLGHEVMHIMDWNRGKEEWNPDSMQLIIDRWIKSQ